MDQRWNAPPDSARRIENMGWDGHDGWHDIGAFRQIVHDTDQGGTPYSAEQVYSLMWFAQHNGAKQWLLYEAGGELRYFKGNTPAAPWTAIADFEGRTLSRTEYDGPHSGASLATWGGRAYIVNGEDEPISFNGDWASPVGFRVPAGTIFGMSISQNTSYGTSLRDLGLGVRGTSGDRPCAYTYRCSFVNEYGQESPLSEVGPSILITNSTTGKIGIWLEVPVGPPGTVARRIYRSENSLNSDGEPFSLGESEIHYFREEILDNCTDFFEDWLPDTGLGAQVDPLQLGPFPSNVKFIAEFKGSMFTASSSENGIRYSRAGFPEVFPPLNFIPVGSAAHGPFMGMRATKNALVVFRQRAIFLIRGDDSVGFYADPLATNVGCAAPNTIEEVPGLGLAFLSENGLWLLEGALENTGTPTKVVRLSTPLPDEMERLNTSALALASAAVTRRRHELWVSVPSLSQYRPDMALVWNYEVNAWSVVTDLPSNRLVETGDHRQYLMFASNDTNRPGVMVLTRGWQDADGTTVSPSYESAVFDAGSFAFNFHPRYLNVQAVTMGNNNLNVDYRVNRKVRYMRAEEGEDTFGLDQQNPDDALQVYDTAEFGTGYWGGERPGVFRYDLSAGGQPQCRDFQFKLWPASKRVHLIGYELLIDADQPKAKPLNITSHNESY